MRAWSTPRGRRILKVLQQQSGCSPGNGRAWPRPVTDPKMNPPSDTAIDARARMAEALVAAAGYLAQARDSRTVAQRVVDEVRALFHAMGALLCHLDASTRTLEAIAVSGEVGSEYGAHLVFAPGMGTPGLAATTVTPVITSNVLKDPRITLSA